MIDSRSRDFQVHIEAIAGTELTNTLNVTNKNNIISQHELMQKIHEQFQLPEVKKLFPDPAWTEEVFWVIYGNVYFQYPEENEPDGKRLEDCINQYIREHGYVRIPLTRDLQKTIIDFIKKHSKDSTGAKYADVALECVNNGIEANQFNETLKYLKRSGQLFEPKAGFLMVV